MPGARTGSPQSDSPGPSTSLSAFATWGSGKTHSTTTALTDWSPELQRFALLLVQAVEDVADEAEVSETDVRSMVYRMFQAALLQQQRAPRVWLELAKVLSPTFGEFDSVPYATVEQARRLAEVRAALLRKGAWSTAAIAGARSINTNNARQWVSRHRKAQRIFTVTHEGETLVPAFLLDEQMEPDPRRKNHSRSREAGEDGWALWAWFSNRLPGRRTHPG